MNFCFSHIKINLYYIVFFVVEKFDFYDLNGILYIQVGGSTRLGLLQSCLTVYNRPSVCYTPDLSTEWWITLISILSG